MKIAIINETSAADRNGDIVTALENRGHEIINAGMKKSGVEPQLSYIHTGFMSALLLNLGRADFVVGGCGTGQGYLNSVLQYPGVVCGHILNSMDAWLFAQINGGNCVSLALHQGYGWASDVNLVFIFDRLFSVERGGGYPPHRKEPQRESRELLNVISTVSHRPFAETVELLPKSVTRPVLTYPGLAEIIDLKSIGDARLKSALESAMKA